MNARATLRSSWVQLGSFTKFAMKHLAASTVLILSGLFCAPAIAEVRELARAEIRENVRLGNSLSLSRLKAVIASKTDGEMVDVRAFETDAVYYRVLLKKPDGRLTVAVVDARSGAFMSAGSAAVKEVMAAAKSKGKSGRSTRSANGSNAGGNGNGNGNSGINGNSGGNGGGNSGGNGGGNSGGNGGGNSGGNGKK